MSLLFSTRQSSCVLLIQGLIFLGLAQHICSLESIRDIGDVKREDTDGRSNQMYFFWKLWSPPLLQNRQQPKPPPPPRDPYQLSHTKFYHTYGKRNYPEPSLYLSSSAEDSFQDYMRRKRSPASRMRMNSAAEYS